MAFSRLVITITVCALVLVACAPTPDRTPTPTTPPTPTRSLPPLETPGSPAADLPGAPASDAFDLARRYRGFDSGPLPAEVLYGSEDVGAVRVFRVINPVGPSVADVETVLRHTGEYASWYVATNVSVDDALIEQVAVRFDEEIYPHVVETFAPGLELSGPISVVTAELTAFAGYFSASDALPRAVYSNSNERMGIFMHHRTLGTDTYLGTLAHELQHVVQWHVSPREETWVNEGLAEFAARSMGLPALPFSSYQRNPEVSLTHWPDAPGTALPNYAGGALFITYLVHRTGIENLHRLVAQPLSGVRGVRAYIEETLPEATFEDIFGDWLVANIIEATTGPYAYPAPVGRVDVSRVIRGPGSGTAQVNQFGAWYMRIEPGATPLTFRFNGRTATAVLPVVPQSGEHCWWSNRGDGINSTLTRALDLTTVDAATLQFWTWYHIERDWDHGYVSVSLDDGDNWTALQGRHTRTDNPVDVAYGPSYTGASGRWLPESIDLSPYAGNEVLLRFEYVTDEAINAVGWCVDDIEVPEIGFSDNVESPEHDWEADGFLRLSSRGVQQQFLVRLVEGAGNSATVTSVSLDESNDAVFVIERPTTLVVSAIAPKTSQPGSFAYDITR